MYLLDTHILLWWLEDPRKLSPGARKAIADPQNTVFTSVASLWEMAIKARLGKLELPGDPLEAIGQEGFRLLDIKARHTLAIQQLAEHHRDPFDHLLIAQAITEKLTLISRDGRFSAYNVPLLNG